MKRRLKSFRAHKAMLLGAAMIMHGCQGLTNNSDIDKILPQDTTLGTSQAASDNAQDNKVSFEGLQANDPQAKLGAAQHPKIIKSFGGVYEDQKLETVLAIITGRLVAKSKDPGRAYNITVLNSPSVNAFALPGGYLYLTRGLLALANDGSEVAAVIAHEMAHVSSNHGIQRHQQAKAVDIADKVVNNVLSNPIVGKVAKASTERRLAAFSQKQELQADAVGIKLLGRAGFDPYAASRFLTSMERYATWRNALNGTGGDDMNSSHPSTPQRIELARRHARLIGPPGSEEKLRERYLQGINGLLFGDTEKEGYVRGQKFLHKKLGFEFTVPEGFELSNQTTSVLASGPGQSAVRFDAVSQKRQPNDVADYLKSGWVNGLIPTTVTKTTVNGLPAAQALAESGDWQFHITAILYKKRFYRFILAAPRTSPPVAEKGREIAGSFRKLSSSEIINLQPLRIRLGTASASATPKDLSRRMVGVKRANQLFKALNGVGLNNKLPNDRRIKLVQDR